MIEYGWPLAAPRTLAERIAEMIKAARYLHGGLLDLTADLDAVEVEVEVGPGSDATTSAEDERIAAWAAIAEHPFFAPCYATAAPLLLSMLDRLDGLAAQPPAVVLPTVDEVAEAILASPTSGEGWHVSGARAALDLIAARVPVWQPVEPGTTIKAGTRYRCETVDGESTEGTYRLDLTTHEDGWLIDPRTVPAEPEDPRVAVVIQWWRGSIEPMATDKDAARTLLARLDALGTWEPLPAKGDIHA